MGKASRQKRERRAATTPSRPLLPMSQIGGIHVVRTGAPDFPYIKVGVTPDLIDECFVVELDGPGQFRHARLRLHTTEVLDLQKKLSNAITDWMALSALRVAELQEGGEPEPS
jgi:hypothetical protein